MKSTAFPNIIKAKEFLGEEGGGKITESLLKER